MNIPVPYNEPPYEWLWIEPSVIPGACCVNFITRQQIIDWYGKAESCKNLTDDEIVVEFAVVHWATRIPREKP